MNAQHLIKTLEIIADRLEAWENHHQIAARHMAEGEAWQAYRNSAENYAYLASLGREAIAKAANEK